MRDIMGLMKQAGHAAKMQAMQAEARHASRSKARAGGGVVTVKVTGKGDAEGDQHRPLAAEGRREGNPRGSHRRGA